MQESSTFADAGNGPVPGTDQTVPPTGSPAAAARRSVASAAASDDRVQAAFVSLSVARLERDHVALLAALCDLEQEQRAAPAGSSPVMKQALGAVLREELRQTQRALERAASGTLGYCERCQAPLAVAVVLSQPATAHCPACAAIVERGSQVH